VCAVCANPEVAKNVRPELARTAAMQIEIERMMTIKILMTKLITKKRVIICYQNDYSKLEMSTSEAYRLVYAAYRELQTWYERTIR
jgi:phenolic acid decarboxylase